MLLMDALSQAGGITSKGVCELAIFVAFVLEYGQRKSESGELATIIAAWQEEVERSGGSRCAFDVLVGRSG
jgi:hypothetical protein